MQRKEAKLLYKFISRSFDIRHENVRSDTTTRPGTYSHDDDDDDDDDDAGHSVVSNNDCVCHTPSNNNWQQASHACYLAT